MVDRIDKLDPQLFRVQETEKDRGRRQGQEQEEDLRDKERDKFDKGRQDWKKLIPPASADQRGELAKKWKITDTTPPLPEEEKELSLSLSERFLVLWGILDLNGRPRIPVMVTYAIVAALALTSLGLIIGILWR